MSVLHNYVFSHFGLPTGFMFSDDDPAFTSRLVQEYLRITQLKWVKTAPHSQWENGRVERRHQMLNLCLLILKDKSEWPSQLPGAAAHALNSLVSSVTGVSASEVEYGRVPRSPFDHARIDATQDFEQEVEDLDTHREERIAHHLGALRQSHEIYTRAVSIISNHKREKAVARLNKRARRSGPEYKVGDRVVCYRPTQATKKKGETRLGKKTQSDWSGPWTIVEIKGSHLYVCTMGTATGTFPPQ